MGAVAGAREPSLSLAAEKRFTAEEAITRTEMHFAKVAMNSTGRCNFEELAQAAEAAAAHGATDAKINALCKALCVAERNIRSSERESLEFAKHEAAMEAECADLSL